MLTNAIAEMRTYGEGFIIADQAPDMLDEAVIRNTNTKIIFRLPDENDCELVGKSIALTGLKTVITQSVSFVKDLHLNRLPRKKSSLLLIMYSVDIETQSFSETPKTTKSVSAVYVGLLEVYSRLTAMIS